MAGLRGRFIVLEGIDGAGTTTQGRLLVERLRAHGHRAQLTREPSDGPVGVLIRQILTGRLVGARRPDAPPAPVDGATVALLFAADRLDHLATEVEPLLADGVHVISDRYVVSSLAYQSSETDAGFVREINRRARPADLTLLVDVPAKLALERRAARGGVEERFDALAVQRRIARAYRRVLADAEGLGPTAVIDGRRSVEAVAEAVWAQVAPVVGQACR